MDHNSDRQEYVFIAMVPRESISLDPSYYDATNYLGQVVFDEEPTIGEPMPVTRFIFYYKL